MCEVTPDSHTRGMGYLKSRRILLRYPKFRGVLLVVYFKDLVNLMKSNFRITKVSERDATLHENCAKAADTVIKHAKCVSDLLRRPTVILSRREPLNSDTKHLLTKLKPDQIHQPAKPLERLKKYKFKKSKSPLSPKVPAATPYLKPKLSRFKKLSLRFPSYRKHDNSDNLFNPINLHHGAGTRYPSNEAHQWRLKSIERIGPFSVQRSRRKRNVKIRNSKTFHLNDRTSTLSIFGLIAKKINQQILKVRNKAFTTS